jgi:hypothetical protein
MAKTIFVISACIILLAAGSATAGPVEISGGLNVTGISVTDGVIFPDLTKQTTAGITSISTGEGLTGGPITSIGTISIAPGGVDDSMLATGISGSKIIAGSLSPSKIGFYSRVASGGDYSDPAEAMAAANPLFSSGWCTSPSASSPCLLKIMPGQYDIGTSYVGMQSYIDIEGSGENVTIIQGTIDGYNTGVIRGASSSELRFLTVKNIGDTNTNAVAIYNSGASPKLTNVTITSSGATNNYGVYNYNPGTAFSFVSPTMTNVTIYATGGAATFGVYNDGTQCGLCSTAATMKNSTISAAGATVGNYGVYINKASATIIGGNIGASGTGNSYGVYTNASGFTAKISHSVIGGGTNSIFVGGGTTYLANTEIDSGISGSGAATCAGVYDGDYTFYPDSCP